MGINFIDLRQKCPSALSCLWSTLNTVLIGYFQQCFGLSPGRGLNRCLHCSPPGRTVQNPGQHLHTGGCRQQIHQCTSRLSGSGILQVWFFSFVEFCQIIIPKNLNKLQFFVCVCGGGVSSIPLQFWFSPTENINWISKRAGDRWAKWEWPLRFVNTLFPH